MRPGLRTDTMQASTKQHRETAMKKAILTASLLALGLGAASGATAAGFNYSYVEGGFGFYHKITTFTVPGVGE